MTVSVILYLCVFIHSRFNLLCPSFNFYKPSAWLGFKFFKCCENAGNHKTNHIYCIFL